MGTEPTFFCRPYNEDRAVVKALRPNLLYFAVFDGHGGSECADYCYHHFEEHLLFWIERGDCDLQKALDSAFLELNNAYSRWWTSHGKETGNAPGSTATVSLLHNNIHLYLGHVGDSRAILCRNDQARRLTSDHCPSLLSEKNRVEQSKGKIITDSDGRSMVNGRLAMTRSIGDLDLKPFGVTCVPDIRTLEVNHGRDAFLVLTTDGINCVMSDQEICDVVRRTEDPMEAAHSVTDHAVQYSSEDNATAVVVPLGSWGNNASNASIFYSFGRSMTVSSRFS